MVCGMEHMPRLSQSLFFAGTLAGALISGHLSDRFGRKVVFLFGTQFCALANLAGAFSPNVYFWIVFKIIAGM